MTVAVDDAQLRFLANLAKANRSGTTPVENAHLLEIIRLARNGLRCDKVPGFITGDVRIHNSHPEAPTRCNHPLHARGLTSCGICGQTVTG